MSDSINSLFPSDKKKPRAPLTEQEKLDMADMARRGIRTTEIAAHFGCADATVYVWLATWGIKPARKAKFITEEEKDEVERLCRSGMKVADIVATTRFSRCTVYATIKDRGIVLVNPNYVLTDTDREDIPKLFAVGKSFKEIAATKGVHETTIREALIKAGVDVKPVAKPKVYPPKLCPDCGKILERKFIRRCKDCRGNHKQNLNNSRSRQRIEAGLCPQCCKPKVLNGSSCEDCRARGRKRTTDRKKKCIDGYGGKCACCGETELAFLTIDHINNDGAERRRNMVYNGSGTGSTLYYYILRNNFPDIYQVLCFNCNWGKRLCGVCPHKTKQMKCEKPN